MVYTNIGRRNLYVDVKTVGRDNVVEIIEAVKSDFLINQQDCDRLLVIESGVMPLTRDKLIRPEIDIQTVDNIAHEISLFKESFHWGNPISFVQRGIRDSGTKNENEGITLLNECYAAENVGQKQSRLGHFVEITGIGYSFVDVKGDWTEGDSYFELETLDPRYAFIVRSSLFSDHRPVLGVTFREDSMGNTYYTAFSKDYRFEIESGKVTSVTKNVLGMIPIIEWERSNDRMGVFEREIPEIHRLNIILSDIANNIDGDVQMLWWANNIEFPRKKNDKGEETDEIERPQSGEWIVTQTTKDQSSPSIKPLTTDYDYAGILNNYSAARKLILERTYTPQRNDNSGSSSGSAMSEATGFASAEQVACAQQLIMESAKMNELRVVLAAIKKSNKLVDGNPLKELRYMDCRANITRQKLSEMTIKTTALANMLSHGINGLHALKAVSFFEDVTATWEDSRETIEMYQRHTFGDDKEVEMSSNLPDYQVGNTPLIDGMQMVQPKEMKDGNDVQI